ncbi:hypothetical protein [Bradyrhizobium iriomotense]|uniref:hypothetical protein n=1 Tax=Bradyrhizobium iriomotense TaxID=441950 RepID=UPI001B89D9F8|nr:hypothetical protein [Bradyrhizobium iriomotense]MBR1129632.1 hypothetical protein [Bradyrhizobium iriomotense]
MRVSTIKYESFDDEAGAQRAGSRLVTSLTLGAMSLRAVIGIGAPSQGMNNPSE